MSEQNEESLQTGVWSVAELAFPQAQNPYFFRAQSPCDMSISGLIPRRVARLFAGTRCVVAPTRSNARAIRPGFLSRDSVLPRSGEDVGGVIGGGICDDREEVLLREDVERL